VLVFLVRSISLIGVVSESGRKSLAAACRSFVLLSSGDNGDLSAKTEMRTFTIYLYNIRYQYEPPIDLS
jgi:hypothetical protein